MKLRYILLFFISLRATSIKHAHKKKTPLNILLFVPDNPDYVLPTALLILKNIKNINKKTKEANIFAINPYLGLEEITSISDPQDPIIDKTYQSFIRTKNKWQKLKLGKKELFFIFKWKDYDMLRGKQKIKKLFADCIEYLGKKYTGATMTLIAIKNAGNFVTDCVEQIIDKKITSISNLVLLGTSIAKKIEKKIQKKRARGNYFFEKVYQIYSRGDIEQIKNIYLSFPFCKRTFSKERKNLFNIDFSYLFSMHKDRKTKLLYRYLPSSDDFVNSNYYSLFNQKIFYPSVVEIVPKIINRTESLGFHTQYKKLKTVRQEKIW
jgi:hypothetical protein